MVRQLETAEEKRRIAAAILHRLPQWFGLPDSTAEYIRGCGALPFWAWYHQGGPAGFIALRETSPFAGEIYCMGVLPECHRRGAGRALFDALVRQARDRGYEFLQVKTLKPGCCPEYDATNRFYQALGFRPLECLPTLWGEQNPCQIYIMSLKEGGGNG